MQQNTRDPRRKGKIGCGSLCSSTSISCPPPAAASPCKFGPLSHLSNQHPLVVSATSFAYRRIFLIRRTTARSACRKQFSIQLWARVHDDFVAGVDIDGFTEKELTMENKAGGDLLFGHRPVRAGTMTLYAQIADIVDFHIRQHHACLLGLRAHGVEQRRQRRIGTTYGGDGKSTQ